MNWILAKVVYFRHAEIPAISGSHSKMARLVQRIDAMKIFEYANDDQVQLKAQYIHQLESGLTVQKDLQPPWDNPEHNEFWDLLVCERMVLSPKGERLFAEGFNDDLFDDAWDNCTAAII